jgi:glucokinase
MGERIAVGLDIGGTSVVGAVVDADARLLARATMPTNSRRGLDDGLVRLRELVARLLSEASASAADLVGIGVGASGPVDAAAGTVNNPYTLPGWDGMPIVPFFEAEFHHPACVIGDCQAAALGEYWNGAGGGSTTMLYMTVGTGIGGGLIVNGRLYRGVGDATEVGHQVIDLNGPLCYCGGRGCLEVLAAGPAIARQSAEEAPAESTILTLADGDRAQITAAMVTRAAQEGDPFAASLVARIGFYLGTGVANLINILAPDTVILGGGVMQSWESFAPSLLTAVRERGKVVPIDQIRVLPARLGLNAGVTGAARVIWLHTEGRL